MHPSLDNRPEPQGSVQHLRGSRSPGTSLLCPPVLHHGPTELTLTPSHLSEEFFQNALAAESWHSGMNQHKGISYPMSLCREKPTLSSAPRTLRMGVEESSCLHFRQLLIHT